MSKRKISSYLGGERNEETEKDKDQNDLRIEVAEGMVIRTLKWQKHLTKATIFRRNGLKNTRG